MARLVLVMHAPLGAAFAQCAEHILGHAPKLTVFDVLPQDQPDPRVKELAGLLAASPGPVLILSDLYGATPFNIASRALQAVERHGVRGHLLTGTNLCMLLKALTEHEENSDKLAQEARLGALKGIVDAANVC